MQHHTSVLSETVYLFEALPTARRPALRMWLLAGEVMVLLMPSLCEQTVLYLITGNGLINTFKRECALCFHRHDQFGRCWMGPLVTSSLRISEVHGS